jgi:hypothetical protein
VDVFFRVENGVRMRLSITTLIAVRVNIMCFTCKISCEKCLDFQHLRIGGAWAIRWKARSALPRGSGVRAKPRARPGRIPDRAGRGRRDRTVPQKGISRLGLFFDNLNTF